MPDQKRIYCAALLALFLALSAVAETSGEIEIEFMNGVYTDLDSGIQPVEKGAMTIHITSPEHRLTVHGNRLRLTANGDGTVDATLDVDFEGEGHIIADLESAGLKNRFEDQVEVPRQTVSVSGRATLEPIAEGFLMTVVDGPESIDLEIQSDMATQIVGLCQVFERLPLIQVSCSGIESALSVVTVPLPEPGEQFLVPGDQLSAEEKGFFRRFAKPSENPP